jgi:DNA-binding MarR family transcriptional regulator
MSDILRLRAYLPYRLSILSNTVSRKIADLYDREFGINIWQWRVMAIVGEQPEISATELAQRTAMDKVAVSRAVAGLVELGYLDRTPSKKDARRSALTLTKIGHSIYNQIVPLARQAEEDLLADLSDKDAADLERLMEKLAKSAEPERDLW